MRPHTFQYPRVTPVEKPAHPTSDPARDGRPRDRPDLPRAPSPQKSSVTSRKDGT